MKEQLEKNYLKVRSEIQAQISLLKVYADNIQLSREKIGILSRQLEDIQNEYLKVTNQQLGEHNEQ
jgi:hypothetical protein